MNAPVRQHTDVVVIGAGPTGLTAAVRLAQLGIDHVVVDKSQHPTSTSKAALVHAATLELFEHLGVVDEAIAAGVVMRRLAMVDRGRPLMSVDFGLLATAYPFALGLPQSTTERLLLRRLHDFGGSVHRPVEIDSVARDGDGYVVRGREVTDQGSTADEIEIRARFVIGADGAHSLLREAVGIGFEGSTYAEHFVLADVGLNLTTVRGAGEGEGDQATIHLSPRGVTVLGRLPGGTHRVVATVPAGLSLPAEPDREFVDELLRGRGVPAVTTAAPLWSSTFRVHHRIADVFRVEGVLLAGDAAHVHSPAAGQGMNTGIADAFDAATRVVAVLTGRGDDALLEEYATARRAAALEVLRFTDRMTRTALISHPLPRAGRRLAAHAVGRSAFVQRRLATWVTGLQRSPLRSGVLADRSRPGHMDAGHAAENRSGSRVQIRPH